MIGNQLDPIIAGPAVTVDGRQHTTHSRAVLISIFLFFNLSQSPRYYAQ